MRMENFKKILRQSKLAVKIYYHLKRLVIFPLKFTPLKPFAKSTFPLKELLKPKKLALLIKVAPYSVDSYGALGNVYDLARDIEERGIKGAYVECGTWKGGCAAVMGAMTKRFNSGRTTWYFDSFEGMPEPTEKDARGRGKTGTVQDIMGDKLKASVSDVEEIAYKILQLSKDKNIIVKGWFKDTLPQQKQAIGPIAILRLDGDWYESTMTALTELFNQVVPGGYVIIDDYGSWEGCRAAVHEFRDKFGITMNLRFMGANDPSAFAITPPAYFEKVSGDAYLPDKLIHCQEKDQPVSMAANHNSVSLITEANGAKKGFSIGISFYHSDVYGLPGIHADQEGFYVLEGNGTAKVGDEEFRVEPGVAFIATKGVPHTIKKDANEKHVKVLWSHGAV